MLTTNQFNLAILRHEIEMLDIEYRQVRWRKSLIESHIMEDLGFEKGESCNPNDLSEEDPRKEYLEFQRVEIAKLQDRMLGIKDRKVDVENCYNLARKTEIYREAMRTLND